MTYFILDLCIFNFGVIELEVIYKLKVSPIDSPLKIS